MSSPTAEEEVAGRRSQAAGGGGLPEASLAESLQFVATGLVPSVTRGLFAPRRWAMKALTKANSDGKAIEVLSEIRRKHGGEGVRLLGGQSRRVCVGFDAIADTWRGSATGSILAILDGDPLQSRPERSPHSCW